MLLTHWLRTLAARPGLCSSRPRATRRCHLGIEAMEDRAVPAQFTVITTADNGDNADPTPGSLREAILLANAATGSDTVAFGIPESQRSVSGNWWTIRPPAALPTITDSVAIDGWTQGGGGYHGPPLVVLDGSSAGVADGLRLFAGFNDGLIRGLTINNFAGDSSGATGWGIYIEQCIGTLIQGCYIGLDPTGETAAGNRQGIFENGSGTVIGGTGPGERNVVSGSAFVQVSSAGHGLTLQNNYIGTDRTGTYRVTNTAEGVVVGSSADPLHATRVEGNVISGNAGVGLLIGSSHAVVSGNKIGTDGTATRAIGNGGYGVQVTAADVTIGGSGDTAGNVISANGAVRSSQAVIVQQHDRVIVQGNFIGTTGTGQVQEGVGNYGGGINLGSANDCVISDNLIAGNRTREAIAIIGSSRTHVVGNTINQNDPMRGSGIAAIGIYGSPATGNRISMNSISHNGGLGIDLLPDPPLQTYGVTLNDSVGHNGPNNLQNYPILATVIRTGGGVTVAGCLTQATTPNATFRIEFFANTDEGDLGPDGFLYGEGERYLGAIQVTTDESGVASIPATLLAPGAGDQYVTATATNLATGDTSEFSRAVAIPLRAVSTVAATGGSFVYDGQAHPATGSVTGPDGEGIGTPTFTYEYRDEDGNWVPTGTGGSDPPVEPGYYRATGSFPGNDHYTPSSATTYITIFYEARTLTDLSKAFKAGRAIPIKLLLVDANGSNVSSAWVTVAAIRLERANADGSRTVVHLEDTGNANPGNLFRYDAGLGGYIFNLSTKGLSAGTYDFTWTAEGDPTEHKLALRLV
ncbi:right-handed parallel beta-helix repeat-containing protein [bacterium]|nr:right-handed parallel beta-helix repeat-containing protein [bacterium]